MDGEVIERDGDEPPHSNLQSDLVAYFRVRRRKLKTYAYVEQRVQVSETRFRIPDVCVYVGDDPQDRIFRTPPFICVEILSPEDRVPRAQERIDDCLKFGVAYVWVIDPESQRVWVHMSHGSREVEDGILRVENPELTVNLPEIFAGIDG